MMGLESFVHQQRALRVIFQQQGLSRVAEEVDVLGIERVLVIASKRHVPVVEGYLGSRVVDVVDQPVMHVPVEQVAAVARRVGEYRPEGIVAVGGGSAIGLAKALALRTRLPIVAAPTTFSGSEMTRVWGVTEDGVKTTGRDDVVAPVSVIYDAQLLETFGAQRAVPSAFNAMAHAVEALYASNRTPVTDMYALTGVTLMSEVMGQLAGNAADARQAALYAAWLCGMCLDSTAMGLHHKLCHVLGGTLGLPHAETHTAVLPHVLAYNSVAVPPMMRELRDRLEVADPAVYLFHLAERNGATMALEKLGMTADDIGRVTDMVMRSPYENPRVVAKSDVAALLSRALVGAHPLDDPATAVAMRR